MRKFFQKGYTFLVVALLFVIVAAVSEYPALYIGLGAIFLILGFAVRKKTAQTPEDTPGA